MSCVCAFHSCSCSAEQQPAVFLSYPTSFEVVTHCMIVYMLCQQNVFSIAHVMKAHWLLVRAARRSRTDLQAFTSRALHKQKLQLLTSGRDAFGYTKRGGWSTFTSFPTVGTHIEIFMRVPQNTLFMFGSNVSPYFPNRHPPKTIPRIYRQLPGNIHRQRYATLKFPLNLFRP